MTKIFNVTESGPSAEQVAEGYLELANRNFSQYLRQTEALVADFWSGDSGYTGIEILQAMGTDARSAMLISAARSQLLVDVQALLGRDDLVDASKIQAPYDLTFNEDGSIATWSPRE